MIRRKSAMLFYKTKSRYAIKLYLVVRSALLQKSMSLTIHLQIDVSLFYLCFTPCVMAYVLLGKTIGVLDSRYPQINECVHVKCIINHVLAHVLARKKEVLRR